MCVSFFPVQCLFLHHTVKRWQKLSHHRFKYEERDLKMFPFLMLLKKIFWISKNKLEILMSQTRITGSVSCSSASEENCSTSLAALGVIIPISDRDSTQSNQHTLSADTLEHSGPIPHNLDVSAWQVVLMEFVLFFFKLESSWTVMYWGWLQLPFKSSTFDANKASLEHRTCSGSLQVPPAFFQ